MAQLWINAGMVGRTQLVGLEHILVHSLSWTRNLGLVTVQVEMQWKSKHLTT